MKGLLLKISSIALLMCLLCVVKSHAAVAYHFKPIDKEFDSLANTLLQKEFHHRSEPDARATVVRLKQIAAQKHSSQLETRATFWEARSGQLTEKPADQIRRLEKARSMCDPEYAYDLAFINYQLAGNYQRLGKYYTAYQLIQQALPVFKEVNDDYSLGNTYMLLVLIYGEIGEIDLAVEHLELSRKHYSAARFPLNRVHFFHALLEQDSVKSLKLYKKSVQAGQHEPPMTVQALINMSKIYMTQGRLDSAESCLSDASRIIYPAMHGGPLEEMLLGMKAQLAIRQRRYADVIAITDSVLELQRKFPGEHITTSTYLLRSKALEALGRRNEAYEALKIYQEIQDGNVRRLEAREIPKAREREAIARQKDMIAQLQAQEKARRSRLYLILLGLGVLLAAATGLFLFFYQRNKIRKIQNRELRSNLQQQMVISRMNRENFEQDMKKKDCEISSSVLLLSNKNEVLQHISDITKEYYERGKIPADYVNRVNEVVGDSLKVDDEWDRFKLHFESVHPDFFKKLKARSAEITENDLRLCAYFRIGMRTKEIAAMLAVSPASVNTARYRLRKKLNLSKEESLDDVIRTI